MSSAFGRFQLCDASGHVHLCGDDLTEIVQQCEWWRTTAIVIDSHGGAVIYRNDLPRRPDNPAPALTVPRMF